MLSEAQLLELETTAVELARIAGNEITTALHQPFTVSYKSQRDPVSEIDRHAEVLIRARLAERHPDHDILGEEIDERPGLGNDFVWAIDPIDGTANFVNGFPLFSASVGLLHRGVPVAGALWCAATHMLQPGVYHAHLGGALSFDGQPVQRRQNQGVRRHLVGEPLARTSADLPWDVRQTGSCAIECAFVAAGILRAARFASPNVWDVAGGITLVLASGGIARQRLDGGAWRPFVAFDPDDLKRKPGAILVGDARAVELLESS